MNDTFEELKRKVLEANDRQRLFELQQQYNGIDEPDYTNMSLRDELQTRFDLKELEELEDKYGFQKQQIPLSFDEVLQKDFTITQCTPINQSPQKDNIDLNCYMEFDGENLKLYNQNKLLHTLDAMSGQVDKQAKKYQTVKRQGPIPEGTYYATQEGRQFIDPLNALCGIARVGNWKGSIPAWGLRRIWIEPDKNTNTYGRDGFSIHGGYAKGSAGCIDIPWQTGKLSSYMDTCQESVPVYVHYPKESW